MNNILKIFGINIRNIISSHIDIFIPYIYEIRLRINSPVYVNTKNGSYFLDVNKKTPNIPHDYYNIRKKDIEETIANLTLNSIHAFEKEIRSGYITIEGGHRVGLGGDCIYDVENFKGFKNITSLNIRIAREYRGCSNKYIKYFIDKSGILYNVLIIGPPMSGKTTFIRDLSVNLSDGVNEIGYRGCDITVIDERGEISAVYNGINQMYVGKRTDVLSYCMKKEGFIMSIRSLSPRVIISDELGSKDDFEIIQYALKSGVKIIATAHGFDIDDVKKNIYLKNIIENNFLDRIVILKNNLNPSSVNQIYDIPGNKVIFNDCS